MVSSPKRNEVPALSKTRPLIFAALFAALTAVGAMIRIPLPPSYFTLQYLFSAMAGVLLGPVYGPLSQLLYLALGLLGLPVFASGGGFLYVLQPTFGFLLGSVAAAWIIGKLTRKNTSRRRILLAGLIGLTLLYAVGAAYLLMLYLLWLPRTQSAAQLLAAATLPFLPFDVSKILLYTFLCPRLIPHLGRMHQ